MFTFVRYTLNHTINIYQRRYLDFIIVLCRAAVTVAGPGSKILRGLNTHSNLTLKFYNEELFIYKSYYILYIFYKNNIK